VATDTIDTEVAPGHRLHGAEVPLVGGSGWRYSCSCREITDVGTEAAQAHVDEVTP
jgi:hypothetical protein